MTLNLPEDFFHGELAVYVPAEYVAEFIEACFMQYTFRTEPNDSLMAWCMDKITHGRKIYVYHSGRRFSAFTETYGGMKFYTIVQMEEVIQPEANVSDILALL